MDYREIKNRKEAFINWFGKSLEIEDCDSPLFMLTYYFDRYEFNSEQKLWLIWLYGTTYHLPTAYIIWNEFPDMELVAYDRINAWNSENFYRLRYQTDTKWNKGHLPTQFLSYKKWVGDRTQREAIEKYLTSDPIENFYNLWHQTNSWYKFGRYSSWFYLQTLKQCGRIPLNVDSLWLHDYSGSRAHRNGLCYAVGKDDWVNKKLEKSELDFLNNSAREILEDVKLRFSNVSEKADYFSMETCLCSFGKIFRERHTRYLGYYLVRQAEEIEKVEADGWLGIDWNPMWDARRESLDSRLLEFRSGDFNDNLFLRNGEIPLPWERKEGLENFFS